MWDETINIVEDMVQNVWGDKDVVEVGHILDMTVGVSIVRVAPRWTDVVMQCSPGRLHCACGTDNPARHQRRGFRQAHLVERGQRRADGPHYDVQGNSSSLACGVILLHKREV